MSQPMSTATKCIDMVDPGKHGHDIQLTSIPKCFPLSSNSVTLLDNVIFIPARSEKVLCKHLD